MADAPEIPEAADPFEKRVAISIAVLAVVLSLVGNLGDNAKTDAILKTNEASNQWGYFQAKSIKEQIAALRGSLVAELGHAQSDDAKEKTDAEALRYEREKEEIKKQAESLQKTAARDSAINDRCDLASLLLQIAIVICSVAILSHWRGFWFAGLALGLAGAVAGATAFLM
jgi:uncharacterized protein (DUF3084 family)